MSLKQKKTNQKLIDAIFHYEKSLNINCKKPKHQTKTKRIQTPKSKRTKKPRKYKAIRVPFNEREFNALAELAELTECSKLSIIRYEIQEQLKIERARINKWHH